MNCPINSDSAPALVGHGASSCPVTGSELHEAAELVEQLSPALIRFLRKLDFPTYEAAWAAMQAESAAENMQRLTRRMAEKPGVPSSAAWVAFYARQTRFFMDNALQDTGMLQTNDWCAQLYETIDSLDRLLSQCGANRLKMRGGVAERKEMAHDEL